MIRATLLAAGCALLLTGCDSIFGDDEDKLSGDRIPVRLTEESSTTRPDVKSRIEALTAATANDEWSQVNGSPVHALGHLAGPTSLNVAWRADLGEGAGSRAALIASPVVSGGRVFALDAASQVSAFDAGSGRPVWRVRLAPEGEGGGDGYGGGLAVSGGRVLATTGFGEALALDAASGEVVWRQQLSAPVRAAPAATQGLMVVVARDNTAYGLSVETGAIIWRVAGATSDAGLLGGASPAMAPNGVVILPFGSGEVVAVRGRDGRRIWADVLSGGRRGLASSSISDISADPVVMGVAVITGNQSGRLVAFDGRSGRRGWTRDFGAVDPIWAEGQTAFVLTDDATLRRLSAQDGSTMWSTPLPAYRNEEDRIGPIGYGGPVLVGGRVLVTSSQGALIQFDPLSGEELGRVAIDGLAPIGPVVAGGTVYVVTRGGTLIALR